MKQFISMSLGSAIGTLLYTGFISSAQQFDWPRAAFVGVFTGICAIVFLRDKKAQGTSVPRHSA